MREVHCYCAVNIWGLADFILKNILVYPVVTNAVSETDGGGRISRMLEKEDKKTTLVPFQNQQNFSKTPLVLSKFVF